MKKIKIALLAFAITMGLTPFTEANAASFILGDGTLGPGDAGFFGNTVAPGVFSDTYSFVATSLAQINTFVASLEFGAVGITGLSLQLFQESLGPDILLATGTPFMGNSDLLNIAFSNLQPGPGYYFLVGGNAGSLAGVYAGAFQLSVVPIPPAIWLFASALVGLAGIARRRRSKIQLAAN